jgi:hypothetical protein
VLDSDNVELAQAHVFEHQRREMVVQLFPAACQAAEHDVLRRHEFDHNNLLRQSGRQAEDVRYPLGDQHVMVTASISTASNLPRAVQESRALLIVRSGTWR